MIRESYEVDAQFSHEILERGILKVRFLKLRKIAEENVKCHVCVLLVKPLDEHGVHKVVNFVYGMEFRNIGAIDFQLHLGGVAEMCVSNVIVL